MTEQEQKAIKWMKNVRDNAVVTLDHIAKEEPNVSPMLYVGRKEKEEDILKFYYCDSEDSYLVGLRIGNFYYAHYIDGRWVFDMSRHLPWGKRVVDDTSAWKEHTYPSEPKEINFSEWLNGFINKECGGTLEECRAAVEKQNANKIVRVKLRQSEWGSEYRCPVCESDLIKTVFFNEDGTEPDEKYLGVQDVVRN